MTSLDSDEAHALPLSMAESTRATPSAPNEMDIWGGWIRCVCCCGCDADHPPNAANKPKKSIIRLSERFPLNTGNH